MKIYVHNGEEYSSLFLLRKALRNISIPSKPTDKILAAINVTTYEREDIIEGD